MDNLTNIWKTITPLTKEKMRAEIEITCMHKVRKLRYKAPHIFHAVMGLILKIFYHTEYTDGVREKVKNFLFPNLYLSEIS